MVITPNDKIGYILRLQDKDGKQQFRFVESEITKTVTRTNSKRTLVYSGRFHAIDIEDLAHNTDVMEEGKVMLIASPFITNDELSERCRDFVDHWNKYGVESIFA